jgi:hypothetical protein
MGSFRFYRRLHIFPGLTVNLSKSGPSLSVGERGAHVTVGKRGITRTVGLPGSGIFYTSRTGYHTGVHSAYREPVPLIDTHPDHPDGWVLVAIILAIVLAAILALSLLRPR